jgi:hypothetical protein
MNDVEIRIMQDKLEKLDKFLRILAAKECNCIPCLLSGCKCCETMSENSIDEKLKEHLPELDLEELE